MNTIVEVPTLGQPAQRRRFTWLWVLLSGVVLYWLVLFVTVATANVLLFPTLLLVGALIVPLTVLTRANRSPHGIPGGVVPLQLLGLVSLLSGVVGVLLASGLEFTLVNPHGAWPMLAVALIEESVKLIVPVVVLAAGLARRPGSGVVVGVASGAGFAVLETMGYAFAALLRTGSLGAVDQTLLLRGVFAPACHIAWTGIAAAMMWRAVRLGGRAGDVVLAVAAGAWVVLLHAFWDSIASGPAHVGMAVVSLVLLWVAMRLELRGSRP